MMQKKTDTLPDPDPQGLAANVDGLSETTIADFISDRDAVMRAAPPRSFLPDSEEAFTDRDPFSADYAAFLKDKSERRRAARVDHALRADLLEKPYLMEFPEEGAMRGTVAVWRSLREQLHREATAILDGSDREEMLLLQRDLKARKMLVDSVAKGMAAMLDRLDQRLAETAETAASGDRPKAGH